MAYNNTTIKPVKKITPKPKPKKIGSAREKPSQDRISYRKGAPTVAKKSYKLEKTEKPKMNLNAKGASSFKTKVIKPKKFGIK